MVRVTRVWAVLETPELCLDRPFFFSIEDAQHRHLFFSSSPKPVDVLVEEQVAPAASKILLRNSCASPYQEIEIGLHRQERTKLSSNCRRCSHRWWDRRAFGSPSGLRWTEAIEFRKSPKLREEQVRDNVLENRERERSWVMQMILYCISKKQCVYRTRVDG